MAAGKYDQYYYFLVKKGYSFRMSARMLGVTFKTLTAACERYGLPLNYPMSPTSRTTENMRRALRRGWKLKEIAAFHSQAPLRIRRLLNGEKANPPITDPVPPFVQHRFPRRRTEEAELQFTGCAAHSGERAGDTAES